jgi:hypothetical protein
MNLGTDTEHRGVKRKSDVLETQTPASAGASSSASAVGATSPAQPAPAQQAADQEPEVRESASKRPVPASTYKA